MGLATSVLPTVVSLELEPEQVVIQKSVETVGDDDTVSVGITVSNTSQQALVDVILVEELLAGISIIETRVNNPTCVKSAASIACNLGTLLSGTSTRVNFVVESGGVNPLLGRTIVRSDALPDVVLDDPYIVKWVSPPFAIPGEEVIWTIYVINPGSIPARNLVVRDVVPEPLTILDADSTDGRVTVNGSDVTLQLTSLSAVQSVTLTVRTRVERGQRLDPIITNNACLTSAQQTAPICVQAPLFRIDHLPRTGESPWWRDIVLMAVVGGIFAGGVFVMRRLRTPVHNV